ncbi:MAG: hypothetical protein A2511_03720 [Deltaproteobacteria bacterium RIFOXYD12_FULL_50_9]|nr:MAG: hypothetical protein A2511_03720 [Deltaproteobacteria bacterium RIFOXYD12_FULL_50_9]
MDHDHSNKNLFLQSEIVATVWANDETVFPPYKYRQLKSLFNNRQEEGVAMPQTVEALYHDGMVELKQKPAGIKKARALVIFLDAEEPEHRHTVDLDKVQSKKSTVDKWVGMIEGAELVDWKAERRGAIERKSRESSY